MAYSEPVMLCIVSYVPRARLSVLPDACEFSSLIATVVVKNHEQEKVVTEWWWW